MGLKEIMGGEEDVRRFSAFCTSTPPAAAASEAARRSLSPQRLITSRRRTCGRHEAEGCLRAALSVLVSWWPFLLKPQAPPPPPPPPPRPSPSSSSATDSDSVSLRKGRVWAEERIPVLINVRDGSRDAGVGFVYVCERKKTGLCLTFECVQCRRDAFKFRRVVPSSF